ncbi:capsule assembly Wzi family protein [Gallaecimonas kandeliae]|uniref:capsule assembly Wzi family protein n=1 Tax=Gallaecimonas kandeliae TaxID=3029055 RepID=UPI002647F59B|nr:capsule assembly Wzi family protein [Gallaecimonas kandeliae]WKE65810.1 capsule assembly Wzi family protein [Gallaecimonas kandeliae]
MVVRLSALASLVLMSSTVMARGVSPYLSLSLSPEIEHQVERVMVLADKPIMTRPIAAATVLEALPKACEKDAVLCGQVKRYLRRLMGSAGVSHASLEASLANNNSTTLANRHGMAADSNYQASVSAYWQPSDYLLLNAGLVSDENNTTLTNTLVSLGVDYAQLDIGYRDHWLSPMTDSSLLLSTNARTMPSITLSNYQPISSWNVQYELFLAEMASSDHISYQGGYTSGHPMLAGLHLSFQPLPGWALGVNRVMQYGGGARGGKGLSDIFSAFFRPGHSDNTSNGGLTTDQEFGNQAASITSRFIFPGETPFSVYFEYGGEDTSGGSNFRLGNAALSGGIHFPRLWQDFDLTLELSEWQNGWYVHHIYQDGLTNDGAVIGHWGANQRQFNDGVGGQSLMLNLGWQPEFGGLAQARYRTVNNQSYGQRHYDRSQELILSYSVPWRLYLVGGELQIGRDALGENYNRLTAFIRF